jgi:cyclopropane fatty-acyl-phospholipid synthase-like methyltransferase
MKSDAAAITRMLTLLGAALSVVVAGASQGTSHRPDVRFLPTPDNVVDAMLELAHVTASDIVFDLGSGDGRIPIAAAKKYGARAVGIEIDEQLVRLSQENAAKASVTDRVTFIHGDLFQSDISQASVVTLFLLPSLNMQLIPKFKRELRPGARIVSHHFGMGDAWLPDAEQDISGLMIYLWAIR